ARIPRLNTIASSFRRRMIRSQPWFSTDSGRLELSLLVFKGSLYWLPILDAEETNVRTRRDEANEARVLIDVCVSNRHLVSRAILSGHATTGKPRGAGATAPARD